MCTNALRLHVNIGYCNISTLLLPVLVKSFLCDLLPPYFLALCVFSFPSCHFGKLYGLVMALSAVFSLLQYPCFALVKVLDGDPLYVNTFLWSILAPYLILSLLTSSSFSLHVFPGEHWSDITQPAGLHPPPLSLPALSKRFLPAGQE